MFAHIHGESFISNTEFEGYLTSEVIAYLATSLKTKSNDELTQIMSNCDEIAKVMLDPRIEFEKGLAAFSDKLTSQVKSLTSDQSILIPAGCYQHAMYLEISRQNNNLITLRLYNTGENVFSYHAYADVKGKLFIQPFVEISGVSEDKLLDPSFLRAYMEVERAPFPNTDDDRYKLLFQGLDGQLKRIAPDNSKLIPPQVSGTCTWSGLMAFVHTFLQPESYNQLIYEIGLESLCAYYQNLSSSLAQDPSAIALLKRGATHYQTKC